ncbi:uncharacterized protein SETTUDRAFT_179657 [Exserohilum turcica Et28A]|uniref:Uncharacterized protein n=1 Tax=Exserohilum turcicum (strain 28A) TaxID=671987 RepID=R0JVX9_EXST2|nr:uncharacterized protein SETTUDRAFT_179657 [Exserohilum turcica Et28A]EOA85113.1 hypothetical protein SETTUDRAFT_179657 [Exserohilum turcica Et28A]
MADGFSTARTTSAEHFVSTKRHDTYPYIDPKNFNLKGKHVFITGASKGLGKATALSYAQAGASSIALGARSSLESVAQEVVEAAKSAGHPAPRITTLSLDVTSEESVEAAANQVSKDFDGRIDILINNAGYLSTLKPIPESTPSEWWRMFEVNLKGPYLVFRAFYPLLLKSSLKIVINVVSVGGITTLPHNNAYGTSKMAMIRVTEFINQDHGEGKDGIVAVAVHPGAIPTDMGLGLPEYMHTHLIDTPALAGHTLLWLGAERREWLGGRYVSACWDLEELSAKKEEIMKKDFLKMRLKI